MYVINRSCQNTANDTIWVIKYFLEGPLLMSIGVAKKKQLNMW